MRYQYRYYFHNAQQAYDWSETMEYIIEMCNITKEFPGIIANDDITLQLKKEKPCFAGRKRCRQIHPHERSVRYVSAGKGMYQNEWGGCQYQ